MDRFRHLRDEQGFAMLVVMVLMLVGGAFVAAALASADNDQPSSRHAQDRKAAYAAAEAGLEYYKFHLADDNDYWTSCTNVPAPSALNDEWNPATSPTDTRTRWRTVPDSAAEYAVELLPASGTSMAAPQVSGAATRPAPPPRRRACSTPRARSASARRGAPTA